MTEALVEVKLQDCHTNIWTSIGESGPTPPYHLETPDDQVLLPENSVVWRRLVPTVRTQWRRSQLVHHLA